MNRPRITTKRAASEIADKYIRADGGEPSEPSDAQDIDRVVEDRVVEIERLAALDTADYEAVRIDAAKRLRFRQSFLDAEVRRKRQALGLETDQDDGQGRAVKIPDVLPWHEPVDGDMLATMLSYAVKSHVVIRDETADAIVFWILHTWLVNDFRVSPRLAITSPTKGCGKTRVLELLNLLVRRPKPAGSITPPALFRAIEKFQPTMLLDENEKYLEIGSEFHAMLNEGHAKGATVLRVLGEKLELREFAVFGAVAFARNGKVPDDLEQRSIVIELHRRRADEPISELRNSERLQQMRRMCARWADDNRDAVANCDADMGGLINRIADNWRPLFTIADCIGGEWPARVRQAAVALAPREADSIGTMLLTDIKAVFDEKQIDRLASADVCEALIGMEGRPWADWKAGKPLTPNQLARLLKPFHVAPTGTIRVGNRTPKGYYRNQFEEPWRRYQAADGVNEPPQRHNPTAAGTSGTFQSATTGIDVAVQNCEKPLQRSDCGVVAVQKRGNDLEGVNGQGDEADKSADDLPKAKPGFRPGTLCTDDEVAFLQSSAFK
jgi:hypothetical protein